MVLLSRPNHSPSTLRRRLSCAAIPILLLALSPALSAHDGEMFETPDGAGRVMSGIGNNPVDATNFEAGTGATLAMEKIYEVFDGLSEHIMDVTKFTGKLNKMGDQGQIPQIGIFFYGSDPNTPAVPMDTAISLGWHDAFIDKMITAVKNYGKPVFIIPGYEFNLAGYTPLDFPKAFRHIVDRFRDQDADNVAWVWNPFVGGSVNIFLDKTGNDWNWWPGAEYVNWIGANGFHPSVWATQNPVNSSSWAMIHLLDHAEAYDIPVMICETSGPLFTNYLPTSNPGSQAQADSIWPSHFAPLWNMFDVEPQMKGFTYLSSDWSTTQWPTWGDHRIQISQPLTNKLLAEMADPIYAHAGQQTFPRPWIPYKVFKTSLGATLHFDVMNLAQGQPGALFLSPTLLPVPLNVYPYPGQFWLAAPIIPVGIFTANANNRIRLSPVIPNDPSLIGLSFESQWITTAGLPKPMHIEIQ